MPKKVSVVDLVGKRFSYYFDIDEETLSTKHASLYTRAISKHGSWGEALYKAWLKKRQAGMSRLTSLRAADFFQDLQEFFSYALEDIDLLKEDIAGMGNEISPLLHFCNVRFGSMEGAIEFSFLPVHARKAHEGIFRSTVIERLRERLDQDKMLSGENIRGDDPELYRMITVGLGLLGPTALNRELDIPQSRYSDRGKQLDGGNYFDIIAKETFKILEPSWGSHHISHEETQGKKPDTYDPVCNVWIDFKSNGSGDTAINKIRTYRKAGAERLKIISLNYPFGLREEFPDCEFVDFFSYEQAARQKGLGFVMDSMRELSEALKYFSIPIAAHKMCEVETRLAKMLLSQSKGTGSTTRRKLKVG